MGKLGYLFLKYSEFAEVSVPVQGGTYIAYRELNRDKSEKFLQDLYGYFRFPLPLNNMTKLETLESYNKLGFSDIVSKTWFCVHPLKGEPCGICTPCTQVMQKGMGYRIPLRGRILYKLLKANSFGRKLDKKLKGYYNRNWRILTGIGDSFQIDHINSIRISHESENREQIVQT
ncbi:MAG: hypothetical protein P1P86_12635 [Bacteroidales bacterium]|nr:hypothetical protein [Bacteroidales bacterium]